MDVDVIRKATTDAEKDKCRKEGRCFNCGRQGHLSRFCPDKKPRIAVATTKINPFATTSVATTTESAKTNPFENDVDARIRAMAKFSMTLDAKQQEKLAAELKKLGADFQ